MDNAVAVASDTQGRIVPSALMEAVAKAREEGKEPFMVNATSGTTVLGAFDPLQEVADVCEQEGLWLHVDVSIVIISTLTARHACLSCLLVSRLDQLNANY